MSSHIFRTALLAVITIASVCAYGAGWPGDPTVNVLIASGKVELSHPAIAPDGKGGAIIAWQDAGNTGDLNIKAQRVTANATLKWGASGVTVCGASGAQFWPQIVADSEGGAYIAWVDMRDQGTSDSDIFIMHIDSNGAATTGWKKDGIPVVDLLLPQGTFKLCSDGIGGAFVSWEDPRTCYRQDTTVKRTWVNFPPPGHYKYDTTYTCKITPNANSLPRLFVQHYNESGELWKHYGVLITDSLRAYAQSNAHLTGDLLGGLHIQWQETHSGSTLLYTQHLSADGVRLQDTIGAVVCSFPSQKLGISTTPDGHGGYYVLWGDGRSSGSSGIDVYGRHVDSTGVARWQQNGTLICNSVQDQQNPVGVVDSLGNLYVVWQDYRNLNVTPGFYAYDLYQQKFDLGTGAAMWAANGVELVKYTGNQINQVLLGDSANGFYVSWLDYRNGANNPDIMVKRVNDQGQSVWSGSATGTAVCASTASQDQFVVCPGATGLLYAWHDMRTPGDNGGDIYAQKVFPDGTLPVEIAQFDAYAEGAGARVRWTAVNELNIAGYEVARSTNDGSFATVGSFTTDPSLAARNNGTTTTYQFADAAPVGTVRYKLVAVERDGARTEFGPVTLDRSMPRTLEITNVYPNPVTSSASVVLRIPPEGATVEVRDLLGRSFAVAGTGRVDAGLHEVTIDATLLPAGNYLLVVKNGFSEVSKVFGVTR